MTYAAGALTQNSVTQSTDNLTSGVATGGTGPYTYQWYRSTTTGFTPGAGSLISGATALTLADSGLVPNTTYFYRMRATDTGAANATTDSAQLAVVTSAPAMNPNAFTQSTLVGVTDMPFNTCTIQAQIDASQATNLYPGAPVKLMGTNAGGVPKVVGCTLPTDVVYGYINYDFKNPKFVANQMCGISLGGNVIYLYATSAISAGGQVQSDALNNGVTAKVGASGASIVGWALDQAVGPGSLIRVMLQTPSFLLA